MINLALLINHAFLANDDKINIEQFRNNLLGKLGIVDDLGKPNLVTGQ